MADKLELIAAVFTPFDGDGLLDLEAVPRQAIRLIDDGVDGAFVCGTTGEGMSMTVEERKAVAQRWMDVVGARLKILVHVGHACLEDACDLASHARSIGAAGVAAVAPFFLKPVNVDDLVACLVKVAGAAGDLPFFYYHIPMATGINTPASEVTSRLQRAIPNFAGVKFTSEDLADLARVTELCLPKDAVYYGRDDLLVDALALGVRGAVGMSYNFAGKHFRSLFDAFESGNESLAAALQADVKTMIGVSFPHGLTNVLKAISSMAGVDCGPSRLPLHTVSSDELQAILATSSARPSIERLLA